MALFFRFDNDEFCVTKKELIDIAFDEGLNEITAFKANRLIGLDHFFCSYYNAIEERGDCGVWCKAYKPRNGRSGICKHWRHAYEPGEKVTFKVPS